MATDHRYDLDKKDSEAKILADKNAHLSQMIENLLAKKSQGLDITEDGSEVEFVKTQSADGSVGSGKRKADSLEPGSEDDGSSENIGSHDSSRSKEEDSSDSSSSSSEDSDSEMHSLTKNETSKLNHTLDTVPENAPMKPAAGTDNAGKDG